MAKTSSKTEELTRGQRTSRNFRDAAGLPARESDAPKDLSEGDTTLAQYDGPEGGYGGDDGITNQPFGHETVGPETRTEPDPAALANKKFVNDLDAYDTSREEAEQAEEDATSEATVEAVADHDTAEGDS